MKQLHLSGKFAGIVYACLAFLCASTFPTPAQAQGPLTPPATSSLCSPGSPAVISGSRGAQGVLDPANTIAPDQPEGGLIWPAGHNGSARIDLDTGLMTFFFGDPAFPTGSFSAQLPGVSGVPAFPDGMLNFASVRLPPGAFVDFIGNFQGEMRSMVILSC